MKYPNLLVLLTAISVSALVSAQRNPSFKEVFKSGESGFECFRIPAIVRASSGKLLAFAEGWVKGCGDFGDVDFVMKTSKNGGKMPIQI